MTENPFIRSAAILTEHLGYVPIALIDDVINAANEILYKCTAALDQFLASRYPSGHLRVEPSDRARLLKRRRLNASTSASPSQSRDSSVSAIDVRDALDDEENGEIDIAAEMELGTAKFETLFESIVDKCFDKYELYLLRNLLVIPGIIAALISHYPHFFKHNNSISSNHEPHGRVGQPRLKLKTPSQLKIYQSRHLG